MPRNTTHSWIVQERAALCAALLAVLLTISTTASAAPTQISPRVFWIAPNGNDDSAGTKSHPFRSLERARDAARALSSRHNRKIIIYLRGGEYRLQQPFTLDHRDSGRRGHELIFRAAPGERPVVMGSIKVGNWTLTSSPFGIYQAYVGTQYKSRQLYVNGERATRAQTEAYPLGFLPVYIPGGSENGISYIPTFNNPSWWMYPQNWQNQKQIEAVILTQWKMMRVPVDHISAPESDGIGHITMQNPGWENANMFYTYNPTYLTWLPGIWSFWQVTRFENALEFLDQPGEWYLDETSGYLYYRPRWQEDMNTAAVELPILETLVEGHGEPSKPLTDVSFKGITFAYATWLSPSTDAGYVSDQSGFHLVGDHEPNIIGHDENDVRTPGNVKFQYAHRITFRNNYFKHLGAVGLDFDTGSQDNKIINNEFSDISSAGIQLGGIAPQDHHPSNSRQLTRDNLISDNLVCKVGVEYQDAAGIFVGFTTRTNITHNTICEVPWAGIAIGWGWGLLDPGSYPGVPGAVSGMWGEITKPSANHNNKITRNRFEAFLNVLWDGGAVYTQGRQGNSLADGLLIAENVAYGKRPLAGGNTFYTDGGTRYVTLRENVSYDNPIGYVDLGPCPTLDNPLPYSSEPCLLNIIPYGNDTGGCRTYGDILYQGNYFLSMDFFDICPYRDDECVSYPTNLTYRNNHIIDGEEDVPKRLLRAAGRRR